MCVGDQLSRGPLQVRQGVPKHLRAGDGAHGRRRRHLAGQWIELVRAETPSVSVCVTEVLTSTMQIPIRERERESVRF